MVAVTALVIPIEYSLRELEVSFVCVCLLCLGVPVGFSCMHICVRIQMDIDR